MKNIITIIYTLINSKFRRIPKNSNKISKYPCILDAKLYTELNSKLFTEFNGNLTSTRETGDMWINRKIDYI